MARSKKPSPIVETSKTVKSLVEEKSKGGSSKSLTSLSSAVNPINSPSRALIQEALVREFLSGSPAVSSPTTGKRHVSVQAYSLRTCLNNGNIPSVFGEGATVISATPHPENGIGYDPLVSIEDVTPYNSGSWYNSQAPNATGMMQTTIEDDNLQIVYNYDCFKPAIGQTDIRENGGTYMLTIELTFFSGHTRKIFVIAPIGGYMGGQVFSGNYGFSYVDVGNIYATHKHKTTDSCSTPIGVFTDLGYNSFNSKGPNTFYTDSYSVEEWYILTAYSNTSMLHTTSAGGNPNGDLQPLSFITKHAGNDPTVPLNLLNPIWTNHSDPFVPEEGILACTLNQNELGAQEIHRLDVVVQTGNTAGVDPSPDTLGIINSGLPGTWADYDAAWNTPSSSWFNDPANTLVDPNPNITDIFNIWGAAYAQGEAATGGQPMLTYTVYYAENLVACDPVVPTVTYEVCGDTSNPLYFGTTSNDCDGITIPATDLPGGANYTAGYVAYTQNNDCCFYCSLELTSQDYDVSVSGATDGYVNWDVSEAGNPTTPSGDPFSTGGLYTVTLGQTGSLTLAQTAMPAGGATFATNITTTTATPTIVTIASSAQVATGMQVSGTGIPAGSFVGAIHAGNLGVDVTKFYLVDNTGSAVAATGGNVTVSGTFATGFKGSFGALAPNLGSDNYILTVTDDEGCSMTATFAIKDVDEVIEGCTDSGAINYDSTATLENNTCYSCATDTGLITEANGGNVAPMFTPTTVNNTDSATWSGTAHNSDGKLFVSATLASAVQLYVVYDTDSTYTFDLYKTNNYGDLTGAVTIGSQVSGGNLSGNNLTGTYTYTGLAPGYYAIKVKYNDASITSNLEQCFTYFYAKVKGEVCDDINNASYVSTPTQIDLRDAQNTLLCAADDIDLCCKLLDIGVIDPNTCNPYIVSTITCENIVSTLPAVTIRWYFNDGSGYVPIDSYNIASIPTPITILAGPNGTINSVSDNFFLTYGSGDYKIEASFTDGSGQVCVEILELLGAVVPIPGCGDPLALNYNALATCGDGSCIYPSWDCLENQNGSSSCQYLTDGSGYYPCNTPGNPNCCNELTCGDDGIEPIGCTDLCSPNFDPDAMTDDGSCKYPTCMDPTAANYLYSCCVQDYIDPSVYDIISDPTCCVDPCDFEIQLQNQTTNASSTCTSSNPDGQVYTNNVVISSSASSWTWSIYQSNGTLVYSDTAQVYTGTSSLGYVNLSTGTYYTVVTDNLNCASSNEPFTIESTALNVGCMNVNAENYDAAAECDCGCCEVKGCMDENATNYNENANIPGDCIYPPPPSNPCVPITLAENRAKIQGCLSIEGSSWLRDYKIGRADDCSMLNKWKLILIDYLLAQPDLNCLFNCADLSTVSVSSLQDCNSLWTTGGPTTGLNHDNNHQGAKPGTVVTHYDGFPNGWFGEDLSLSPSSNITVMGDVIKFYLHHSSPFAWLNNTIWVLGVNPDNTTGIHNGCKNHTLQHYTQCLDHSRVNITTTVNYYDKFINFVNNFCQDCNTSLLQWYGNIPNKLN